MKTESFLILDTETTGVSKTDQVIELAFILSFIPVKNIRELDDNLIEDIVLDGFNKRYKPTVPIHPQANKVHGIISLDLIHEAPHTTVEIPKADFIIGHNISFDKRMLLQSNPALATTLDTKYICTLNIAKTLGKYYKWESKYDLDSLLKHLYPDVDTGVKYQKDRHDARTDILKTFIVLREIFRLLPNIESFTELLTFCETLKKLK